MSTRSPNPSTEITPQNIQNLSFDKDFSVLAVELLGYDSGSSSLVRVKTDSNGIIQTSGGGSTIGGAVTGGTAGSVLFVGAGAVLAQDNANFFWDDTNNFLGLGTNTPAARLNLIGGLSAAQWAANGIGIRINAGTYTDTSSSGTVATMGIHAIGTPTVAASSATTYSVSSTLYIANSPTAGSNVTQTDAYAIHVDNGDVRFDGGIAAGGFGAGKSTSPKYNWGIGHSLAAASWGSNGSVFRLNAGTVTDTTTADSATVTNAHIHAILRPTLAATNASSGITYTNSATWYINNSPLAGSNVTITTPLSLLVAAGDVIFNGGLAIGASASSNTELLQINGNLSKAAWTTNGIRIRAVGRTYTDTSSSGAVATVVVDAFQRATLAASNATTYTSAATMTITNSPIAGSNVTITNPYSLLIDDGDVRMDARLIVNSNSNAPVAAFSVLNSSITAAAWGTSGIWSRTSAGTATDSSTADAATVTNTVFNSWSTGTLQATNAATIITYTHVANNYIAGGPTAGTNITITNKYALWVDADNTRLDGLLQVAGSTAPTSQVDVGGAALSAMVIGASGVGIKHRGNQFTDTTTGAGTVAIGAVNSLGTSTFLATNAITYTDAATLYITAAPVASTNVTITKGWALFVDAGDVRLDGALLVGSLATLTSGSDLQVTDATGAILTLGRNDTSVTAADSLGAIRFYSNDTSTTTNPYAASIEVTANSTITTDINPGIMLFKTTGTGVAGALTERMRISPDGLVGIGVTANPLSALTVNGSISFNRRATAIDTTITVTDHYVGVTDTSAARTITLPAASACFDTTNTTGMAFIIGDEGNNAATNNITITRAGSDTFIGGGTSVVINSNKGCVRIMAISTTQWMVIT